VVAAALMVGGLGASVAALAPAQPSAERAPARAAATKIEHLVVVFDENESFDHYFGTYPDALNLPGEPVFTAAPGTPAVDGLTEALLTANPNAANPKRLGRSPAVTCGQDHDYSEEQKAFDGGLMDKFVEFTQGGGCADPGMVMNYYDGNTVTALWNLAQHGAMSDRYFATGFGPSTPGALNLISGNTHGASPAVGGVVNGTVISDPQPGGDDCSAGSVTLSGKNIGDLMNDGGITWGWFQGGFRPTSVSAGGVATCGAKHANLIGGTPNDYIPHHQPFQYYASTRNTHHLPPTSTAMIGRTDQAEHQYDLSDFDAAIRAGNLPQVSFLKAAAFEDGHPGYSGPLDEQRWIARVVDLVQGSPDWASTAVIVTYDDSDGWYDHAFAATTNASASAADQLDGPGVCGDPVGSPPAGGYQNRCGPGPRLPLVVLSPWAKVNAVDHRQTDQTSIIRFIEDNWALGRIGDSSFDASAGPLDGLFDFSPGRIPAPKTFIDPATGLVVDSPPAAVSAAPPSPATPAAPTTPTTPTTTPGTTATTPITTASVLTPSTTTPPATSPVPKPKLEVTGRRRGRQAILALRVTGIRTTPATAASVALTRAGRTLARGKGTLRTATLKLTLKARRTLPKGSYRLTAVVSRPGQRAVRLAATFRL
jgi:phospholipase C